MISTLERVPGKQMLTEEDCVELMGVLVEVRE
jgi:hypothetical protein